MTSRLHQSFQVRLLLNLTVAETNKKKNVWMHQNSLKPTTASVFPQGVNFSLEWQFTSLCFEHRIVSEKNLVAKLETKTAASTRKLENANYYQSPPVPTKPDYVTSCPTSLKSSSSEFYPFSGLPGNQTQRRKSERPNYPLKLVLLAMWVRSEKPNKLSGLHSHSSPKPPFLGCATHHPHLNWYRFQVHPLK